MSLDDQAEAAEQRDRDICLTRRKPELPKTGRCYNCDAGTDGNFCCPECREDFEQRERFNR